MSDLLFEKRDGVALLTLNRPDSLNAFDDDLHRALPAALREVEDDREARVIVLTGAGRAFSAGGNIEDFDKLADDLWLRRATLRTVHPILPRAIRLMPQAGGSGLVDWAIHSGRRA